MESSQDKNLVRFSTDDLELFSQASHDRNPLHLSDDYARKTPFANRVVFGILGGLFGLSRLQDRPGMRLSKIVLEFQAPLFVDLPYSLEINEAALEKSVVRIFDGRRLMSKVTAHFSPGTSSQIKAAVPFAARTKAALLSVSDLTEGFQVEETYLPKIDVLRQLIDNLNLSQKGIGELEIAILLWSSYFVGMELPGTQALFSKFSLNLGDSIADLTEPFSYKASLTQLDDRYNLLRTRVELAADGMPLAHGEIQSFIRPAAPTSTTTSIEALMPRSDALKGKVALVTGASRGLGAAIARTLVLQGCTVLVNFLRSRSEAEQLQTASANAPGKLVLMQGDASELSWCLSTQQEILEKYGKLDFLICNACPAILPLWIEPAAIIRVNDYVSKSLALMSVPMSVFLNLLSENSGSVIVISSVVVSQSSPSDWPHYTSAKHAIEGITRVASVEYSEVSFLLVRPPKLLTGQTNTPMGRQAAISPEIVAVKLVQDLIDNQPSEYLKILEDFINDNN
ncbi:MAG: SDR family NAD(P)-dependent oxidoreductase [Cyanobacteria bacterium P01_C01_bin.120]